MQRTRRLQALGGIGIVGSHQRQHTIERLQRLGPVALLAFQQRRGDCELHLLVGDVGSRRSPRQLDQLAPGLKLAARAARRWPAFRS